MNRNIFKATLALLIAAGSFTAFAAGGRLPSRAVGTTGLPEIQCNRTQCHMVYPQSPGFKTFANASAMVTPAVASPVPTVVGPPAGQRFMWQGAGYPACQSIMGISPGPTMSNPYEYLKATSVPVPLGSTHISLLGSFQTGMEGGPAGAAGDVGMLQVKRSDSSTWQNVSISYSFTADGSPTPEALWGTATYSGLVDLAGLPDGTSIPSEIDVRLAVFPVFSSDGGFSSVYLNSVCWGQLQLTF